MDAFNHPKSVQPEIRGGDGPGPSESEPKEALEGPSLKRIPTFEIDMTTDRDVDDNEKVILELKKIGLYSEKYGYSVIAPNLEDSVRTRGTYRFNKDGGEETDIFVLLAMRDDYGDETLLHVGTELTWSTYANDELEERTNGVPIVVWDLGKLEGLDNESYRFKDPDNKLDAVVAIVKLTNY